MNGIRAVIAALGLLLGAMPAHAQTAWPAQTVHILVGFSAGTAPDIVARVLAEKFAARWGQPVVVEDVTGVNGNLACGRVARSPPDGYVLVMCSNGSLTVGPSLYAKLGFDPVKDFAPIRRVFVASNILVVPPDVPAKSIPELVALAQAKPGQLTYAHTGVGSSQHIAAELFKYMTHTDIRGVAYRGTTAVLPDLLAGRLTMSFSNISNVLPLVREGKLRGFAVSSRKRSGAAPELPTMIEMGYPDFEAVPWFGLLAPAGTPAAIIDKIEAETTRVLTIPEVHDHLAKLGIDVIGSTPAEFSAAITTETGQMAKLIKAAGIQPIQ